MISYFDTSFLVKLFVFEADSADAWRIVQQPGLQAAISWLSEVEMTTALSPRFLRSGGRTASQLAQAKSDFDAQVSAGVYRIAPVDRSVFDLAGSYGERYGGTIGIRALDALHVAAAVQIGAVAFGTFDQRQGQLAEAVGLKRLG